MKLINPMCKLIFPHPQPAQGDPEREWGDSCRNEVFVRSSRAHKHLISALSSPFQVWTRVSAPEAQTELELFASKDYYSIVKAYSLLFVGSNPITYTTFFTSVNSA